MKKGLIISALVLMIAASLIAGTLANYTTQIDDLAEGSVVAKEFILLENGSDTFATDVKIAPTETKTWQFSVKNNNGALVTETAMDLDFDIDVTNTTGKSAIAPLTVTIKDSGSNVVASRTGTGTMHFDSSFALQAAGQEQTYTVEVNWPSDNEVDINYAGGNFGTTVAVSVTGTQI